MPICKLFVDYDMNSDPNDDVDVHLGDQDHHHVDVDVDVDDDHQYDVDPHLGDEGEPILVHDRLHLLSLPDASQLPRELYSSPEPSKAALCAHEPFEEWELIIKDKWFSDFVCLDQNQKKVNFKVGGTCKNLPTMSFSFFSLCSDTGWVLFSGKEQ